MNQITACMVPELELFRPSHIQSCILGHYIEKLRPLNSLQSHLEVIEFVSSGRSLAYLDISNVVLRLVVFLRVKSTQAPLATEYNKTSLIDFPLHSIFSQCEIFLSETSVTKSPHHYAYKTFLDLYTTVPPDSVKSQLAGLLFVPDDTPSSAADCKSWTDRQTPLLRSQRCELMGRLRTDLNNISPPLYLLDNVNFRVRLTLNSPEFYLWSKERDPDIELVIQEAELHCKYFQISPELSLGIERMLTQQNARYPFRSTQIKTFIHPALSELINIPVAFSGKLPESIICTFVKSSDFSGNVQSNPLYFPHSNITELAAYCNGVERKFEFDMTTAQGCTSAMRSLYDQLGMSEDGPSNLYSIGRLKNGHFAVAFDFTLDESAGGPSQNLDMNGTIRIQGKLKAALDHTLVVMIYAEFRSCIEITAAREVILL